jgi:hypothetical protein
MAPGSYALEEGGGMQTPAIDKENEDNYQTKGFLPGPDLYLIFKYDHIIFFTNFS